MKNDDRDSTVIRSLSFIFSPNIFMRTRNIVVGFLRISFRTIIEIIHRLLIHLFDTVFGFSNWPRKKLRIKIFILHDVETGQTPSPENLADQIDYTLKSFSKNFNVGVMPHKKNNTFTEILTTLPPREGLYTKGGNGAFAEEFKTAGSFFAANLAGVIYPVTVFIVKDIKGADGCSLGPMSDYVTIDHVGLKNVSVLAHELAHACGLWHIKQKENLLYTNRSRGDEVKWWQKNVFRSSRHITYW